MVWTSIGGVEVKSLLELPRFFLLTYAARKAALETEGCQAVHLFRNGRRFFAMSVWDSPVAMKTYARSGVHARLQNEDSLMFGSLFNTVLQTEAEPTKDQAVAHWIKVFEEHAK